MLHIFFLFLLFLSSFREDQRPFFFLLNFPRPFLSFPVRCTIVPRMEVHIKGGGSNTTAIVNEEADLLREHRDAKTIVAKKLHMKLRGPTPQAGLQSQSY